MKRRGLPQYVSEFQDRHGKWRYRARRKGAATHYFKNPPGTEAFELEYRAWRDNAPAPIIGAARTIPGSVSDIITRYYRSTTWAALAPGTQAARRNILEKFREQHGGKPFAAMQRHHVQNIIEARAATPEAGKHLLKLIRALARIAIAAGLRRDDPTAGVQPVKNKSDGFHTWTEDEIVAFQKHHAVGTRARLALALLLYTGQRRGDVVALGWQHVREGRIHLRQQKTGATLALTIHPELDEVLSSTPRDNLTFLVTATGKPFTPAGFGNWFRQCVTAAGLPSRCAAHGLRKAAARRLAEAGCTTREIAAVTGHRSLREIERYTAAAEQAALADAAISRILPKPKSEQVLANPQKRLAK